MDRALKDRHLERSRRIREAFARIALAEVLAWAFLGPEYTVDDEFDSFRYRLRDAVLAIDPEWPMADSIRELPLDDLRVHLRAAHERIRAIARAVASREPTELMQIPAQIGITGSAGDRDGRPRWFLRCDVADALVWTALKLFSEVPRSLIRPCGLTGCARIYVASRNQRFCHEHQHEARRQTQREAERAWRDRKRAKKEADVNPQPRKGESE